MEKFAFWMDESDVLKSVALATRLFPILYKKDNIYSFRVFPNPDYAVDTTVDDAITFFQTHNVSLIGCTDYIIYTKGDNKLRIFSDSSDFVMVFESGFIAENFYKTLVRKLDEKVKTVTLPKKNRTYEPYVGPFRQSDNYTSIKQQKISDKER